MDDSQTCPGEYYMVCPAGEGLIRRATKVVMVVTYFAQTLDKG